MYAAGNKRKALSIYLSAISLNSENAKATILSKGFSAINAVRIHNVLQKKNKIKRIIAKTWRTVFQTSLKEDYSKAINYFTNTIFYLNLIFL